VASSERRLLFAIEPPRPISEMTDAERRAFANELFERTADAASRQLVREPPEPDR
jgi:hypothetical protein